MTIKSALALYTAQLELVSPTPKFDVEVLLMEATALSLAQIMAYPEKELSATENQKLQQWILRRLQKEPIAYIVGHQPFWTLDLQVTRDTLIARPETEHLVEWILENFSANLALCVADLGVGSGAIALALASERPLWEIDATDQSAKALDIARLNAKRYALHQVNFYQGDWCAALPHKKYHLMVSNPPYIAENDVHLSELTFEPLSALTAGHDGLLDLQTIIETSRNYLADSGCLVLEHGAMQQDRLQLLLQQAGYTQIVLHRDFAQLPRFVTAIWNGG